MTIAETIKQLRESVGMTRKEFSQHTGIPVRTLEDWEASRRTPPEYIPRLIAYQLKCHHGSTGSRQPRLCVCQTFQPAYRTVGRRM